MFRVLPDSSNGILATFRRHIKYSYMYNVSHLIIGEIDP